MNVNLRTRIAVVCVLCVGLVPLAAAQGLPVGVSWDRTSIEDGFLNDFSLSRTVLGPRAIGMGRAGLALSAGIEYHSLNPASILGMKSIQLFSEGDFRSGSASISHFDGTLRELNTEFTNFSIKPGSDFGYGGLNLGIPIKLLGSRGALGVGYVRNRMTPLAEENRQEALGELTENTPSSVGVRSRPDGGYDRLTFTVARRFMDKVDVGANLNYESGWLEHRQSVDVSVFGRPAAAESRNFSQDFSSLQFDVGARGDFGPLSAGFSYSFGHHIDYEGGKIKRTPLYIIGDDKPITFHSLVMDHTLSVPPRLGFGGAYQVGDRLTVAVDFWTQAWSNASFSRQAVEPVFTFADFSDSSSFFHYLVPDTTESGAPRMEIIGAKMADTKSLRIGVEYYLFETEAFRIPVRAGWHSGGSTRGEVDINLKGGIYSDYLAAVEAYRRDLVDGVENPASEDLLRDFLIQGAFIHRSPQEITSSTVTFGAGLEVAELTIDISLDFETVDTSRYFNTLFSPQWWPFVYGTEGSRTFTTFSLGARIAF